MAETASLSGVKLWGKMRRWVEAHPQLTLTLAVFAMFVPFLAKPFNIDDPLFIWVAHQVQAHPFNPYGFDVNWFGWVTPMWFATENPPVASYYMALAAAVLGWSEISLHFAFLLPAIAVILGTYRLARRFCRRPMLAALATLFTPVFMISGMTVMCDMLMLAFWVWAVVLWVEGMESDDYRRLTGAAILVALAILTKYYGACLIPLLAAYSVIHNRYSRRWTVCFLIPLAALCSYQWITRALYGRAMLSEAMHYAGFARGAYGFSEMVNTLISLTFTGGCLAAAVFFMPLLWRRRSLAAFAVAAALIAIVLFFDGAILEQYISPEAASKAFLEIQIIFWAVGGIGVVALAVGDVWNQRNAQAWLLALWVLGTFSFAAFFNWTVNGRSILPMAPVMGILIARRLDRNALAGWKLPSPAAPVCLAMGAALALLVMQADFLFAVAIRQTAVQTHARFGLEQKRNNFWFEGHWGFQYYMESLGMSALDVSNSQMKPGNILALPENNTGIAPPKLEAIARREIIDVRGPGFLATMNVAVGAGFYASLRGPLPFAFGKVTPERVFVYFLKPGTSTPQKN